MSNIVQGNIIAFVNTELRPMCDLYTQTYNTLKRFSADYTAMGLSTAFAGGVADTIVDGSPADGRNPLTAQDCINVMARVTELINVIERGTLDTSGTVTTTRINQMSVPAVNRAARF